MVLPPKGHNYYKHNTNTSNNSGTMINAPHFLASSIIGIKLRNHWYIFFSLLLFHFSFLPIHLLRSSKETYSFKNQLSALARVNTLCKEIKKEVQSLQV